MPDTTRIYDIDKAIKTQSEYCSKKNYPHFAPKNGVCWKCGQQIYAEGKSAAMFGNKISTGIIVEQAGNELITGCPHCNWSYCD